MKVSHCIWIFKILFYLWTKMVYEPIFYLLCGSPEIGKKTQEYWLYLQIKYWVLN